MIVVRTCLTGLAAIAATVFAAPALAEWQQATSTHFVIYGDASEATLRKQAEQLERFDSVIRYFHKVPANPDDAFNKVTIYETGSMDTVGRLCGKAPYCRNVAGFYTPRVTGSIAFTPRIGFGTSNANDLQPQTVLFHEYAHHFLLGNYASAYPAWFSEGYAEFVSTARITDDYVQLGVAAQHRAYSLLMTRGLSITELFDTQRRKMSDEQVASLYARGWLLTHYLLFDTERRAKLTTYLRLLNAGKPSLAAAQEAFGDLRLLNRDIDRYLHQSKIPGYRIPTNLLTVGDIKVRPLSPGERAMLSLRMQSDRGVDSVSAPAVFAKAEPLAARFADDPVVQTWFAEMAYDAGKSDLAMKAAARALQLDPKASQAMLYKAQVLMRRAYEKKDAEGWKEARSWIIKANRLEPNDAEALTLFYRSFLAADETPKKSAIDGIHRALQLVPQDPGVRFMVARQDILDGKTDDARYVLRPLAYDPHAGADNAAARLIALLDAGTTGQAALDALEKAKANTKDADDDGPASNPPS